MIAFTVPGAPVGKGRPIAGKSFAGFTTLRTPTKTRNYESLVQFSGSEAMRAAGMQPFDEPLRVELDIRVPVPASWSKRKQAQALAGDIWPTTKPDIDNVLKAIADGLNGIAWRDDVLIVKTGMVKRYSVEPGVTVTITKAGESP